MLFGVCLPIHRNVSGSSEIETYGWRDMTVPLWLLVMHLVQLTHKKDSDLGMGFKILGGHLNLNPCATWKHTSLCGNVCLGFT